MTQEQIEKLRFALSVVSGRQDPTMLNHEEYRLLGYDTYRFSEGYGTPSANEIKSQCEEIVLRWIVAAHMPNTIE